MKRILDITASSLQSATRSDLLDSIASAEGRTIASETIGVTMPLLFDVTNVELAASLGADLLVLNLYNVDAPLVRGLPECEPIDTIRLIKNLTGRVVGINLEPVSAKMLAQLEDQESSLWGDIRGRLGIIANAQKLVEQGADFVVLTANPGMGVTKADLVSSVRDIRNAVGDNLIIMAGKMHAAGVLGEGGRNLLTAADIKLLTEAGADVILMPAPATVPGFDQTLVASLVDVCHQCGALAMTTIGTSQEGSDETTIRQIALMSKMAGADIQHIGDAGYTGIAVPENITALSVAIRGRRHTYRHPYVKPTTKKLLLPIRGRTLDVTGFFRFFFALSLKEVA